MDGQRADPGVRWCILIMVSAVAIGACSSGRGEAMKPEPQPLSSISRPLRQDAGTPAKDSCGDGGCVCQPRTCLSLDERCGQFSDGCGGVIDCGRCSRCRAEEMDCCGTCIPRSEGRCPDNVHCPTPLPEM